MIDANIGQALSTVELTSVQNITSSTDHTGVDVTAYVGEIKVILTAVNVAGTDPTLDCVLEESDDDSTYTSVTGGAFTQVTDAGTKAPVIESLNLKVGTLKKYMRLASTIGGTSSPEFTVACHFVALQQNR